MQTSRISRVHEADLETLIPKEMQVACITEAALQTRDVNSEGIYVTYMIKTSIGEKTSARTNTTCIIRIAGIPYRKYQCLVLW